MFLPFLRPKSTGRSNTLKTNRRGRDFKNVRQFNVAFSGWWEKGKKKVAVFEKNHMRQHSTLCVRTLMPLTSALKILKTFPSSFLDDQQSPV